jgi:hypothetical protein
MAQVESSQHDAVGADPTTRRMRGFEMRHPWGTRTPLAAGCAACLVGVRSSLTAGENGARLDYGA